MVLVISILRGLLEKVLHFCTQPLLTYFRLLEILCQYNNKNQNPQLLYILGLGILDYYL